MSVKEGSEVAFRPSPGRGDSGQSSLEWVGLLLAISAAVVILGGSIGRVDPAGLAHSISRSILCAVASTDGCPGRVPLGVYGPEIEGLIRRLAPEIRFGRNLLGMPVDFRVCRSPACAVPVSGSDRSTAGESLSLFTRVIDCREFRQDGIGCGGEADGNLYIQFWAYFPESATLRGVPLLAERGYHRHDWESVQFRIEADGVISQRASSHAGYNHGRSVGNWPSDAGLTLPRDVERLLGRESPGGWGPHTGRWLIEGGSHAGNVADHRSPDHYPVRIEPEAVALVPLEAIRRDPLVRPARFDPITPPWLKRVWSDPEAIGTG